MSTCSATIIRQSTYWGEHPDTEELMRFYRHCDGYPEGHGIDMAEAIVEADGMGADTLLDDERVAAECFFEHFLDCFYENVTQGPVPTYKTAADACQKLDVWMGECHMDMWLKD